jgi:hypothetical protein
LSTLGLPLPTTTKWQRHQVSTWILAKFYTQIVQYFLLQKKKKEKKEKNNCNKSLSPTPQPHNTKHNSIIVEATQMFDSTNHSWE